MISESAVRDKQPMAECLKSIISNISPQLRSQPVTPGLLIRYLAVHVSVNSKTQVLHNIHSQKYLTMLIYHKLPPDHNF
jgi:hypothetical protein